VPKVQTSLRSLPHAMRPLFPHGEAVTLRPRVACHAQLRPHLRPAFFSSRDHNPKAEIPRQATFRQSWYNHVVHWPRAQITLNCPFIGPCSRSPSHALTRRSQHPHTLRTLQHVDVELGRSQPTLLVNGSRPLSLHAVHRPYRRREDQGTIISGLEVKPPLYKRVQAHSSS
jgi:hypothetical protein